jgi:hypothetical protein
MNQRHHDRRDHHRACQHERKPQAQTLSRRL